MENMPHIIVIVLLAYNCFGGTVSGRETAKLLCPKGWIHLVSSCYYFSTTKTTMSMARSLCQNLDGDLVLPINSKEHSAIWKVAKQTKFSNPWIGLIEKQRDKFYTLDGKTPSYTNWGSNQPDRGGNEKCVIFYSPDGGRWHDATCNTNNYYICQRPIKSSILTCDENTMTISIKKSLFKVSSASKLQLLDSSCKPQEKKFYYVFTTSLTACGTTMTSENGGKTVSFHNKVVESLSAFSKSISRSKEIQFPFTCKYPQSYFVSSSTFGLANFTIAPNNASRKDNISLMMGLYTDQSFSKPLVGDPSLSERLYVEIGLNKNNSNSKKPSFGIKLNECYVTSQSSFAEFKYLLIEQGCQKDKTVKFYKSSGHTTRFSFLVFRFRGLHHYTTRVHCRVSLCEEKKKSCHLGCRSSKNGKRTFSDDQQIRYFF